MAHLYLGHLGFDKYLKIPDRKKLLLQIKEIEAESVCYIVCNRNGVKPNSEAYLSDYIDENINVGSMDLYAILKAAGQIETLLGLTVPMSFNRQPIQTDIF